MRALRPIKSEDSAIARIVSSKGDPDNPIRKRRIELGLSQQKLAARIGVNAATIVRWERGHFHPELKNLRQLTEFLGFNPSAESEALPKQLRLYRKIKGLTRKEVASMLKVTESAVFGWETGRRRIRHKYVNNLLELIGGML
jgi:transcriptional regulator with XRE-family HTH domain